MPSLFTPFLNLEKPGQGEQTNTWGLTLNSNFDKLDAGVKANNTSLAGHTTSINTLNSQMASTAAAQVASGLQTQLNTHTNQLASTAAAPVGSGLQTQITNVNTTAVSAQNTANAANSTASGHTASIATLNSQMASTAAAPVTTGLQTQITAATNTANAANSASSTNSTNINTLWAQMGSTGSVASGLQTQITAATNTANAANSTAGANTSSISTLQGQMGTVIHSPSACTLRTASTSSGTITADWIIFRQAPLDGTAVACELAFGRGRGEEGDTITLPPNFSSGACYVEAAMSFVNCSSPPTQLIVQVTGLTLSAVHATVGGNPVGRGFCWASWWCFAWRVNVA
jgi:hypothetical protein